MWLFGVRAPRASFLKKLYVCEAGRKRRGSLARIYGADRRRGSPARIYVADRRCGLLAQIAGADGALGGCTKFNFVCYFAPKRNALLRETTAPLSHTTRVTDS